VPQPRGVADHGERSLDNPLPWTRIAAVADRRLTPFKLEVLRERSAQRQAKDLGFAMLAARDKILDEINEQTEVSLREAERREETKHREDLLEAQRASFLRTRGIEPIPQDEESPNEEALEKEREAISGIQLEEAARILADAVLSSSTRYPRAAMRH